MNFFYYLIFCVGLMVCQTAVLPVVFGVGTMYDLLLAMVAFLGLHRPFREGFPVVLLAGLGVDTISGGPFGLFLTVYVWFYLSVQIFVGVVQVANRWFSAGVVIVGVLLENLAIAAAQALAPAPLRIVPASMGVVTVQLVQAAITAMPFLWCLSRLHRQWEVVAAKIADYMEERRMKW